MDFIGGMLKAAGLDADKIMGQAAALQNAFDGMMRGQNEILSRLSDLADNQTAIMIHLGLAVPPPAGAALALIAAESGKYVQDHGGLSPDEIEARARGSAHALTWPAEAA